MGYGYGVWLTYDKLIFNTKHVPHVTIACFMNLSDASELKDKIQKKFGDNFLINAHGKPITYDKNLYENDNNDIYSWGYDVELIETSQWPEIRKITENYICDIPDILHTSVQYSCYDDYCIGIFIKNMIINCKLVVVDIRSNDPTEWKIM